MKKKHQNDQDKKQEEEKGGDPWSKVQKLVNMDYVGTKDVTRMKNSILDKINAKQ